MASTSASLRSVFGRSSRICWNSKVGTSCGEVGVIGKHHHADVFVVSRPGRVAETIDLGGRTAWTIIPDLGSGRFPPPRRLQPQDRRLRAGRPGEVDTAPTMT